MNQSQSIDDGTNISTQTNTGPEQILDLLNINLNTQTSESSLVPGGTPDELKKNYKDILAGILSKGKDFFGNVGQTFKDITAGAPNILGQPATTVAGDIGSLVGAYEKESPALIAARESQAAQNLMRSGDDRTIHYGTERNIIDDPTLHQKDLSDKWALAEFEKSSGQKIGDVLSQTGNIAGKYLPQNLQDRLAGSQSANILSQILNPKTAAGLQGMLPTAAQGLLVRKQTMDDKVKSDIEKILWQKR